MFGFLFGTFCLAGLVGLSGAHRAHRHHHGRHRGCGGPHGRRHRHGPRGGRRGGFSRAAGEVLKRRLDIDDDQELVVDHALKDARDALKELREVVRDDREALADALRGDEVDQAALDAAFARQDEALARARRQLVSAAKQVHAVLEPEQRATAADLVAHGRPGWR